MKFFKNFKNIINTYKNHPQKSKPHTIGLNQIGPFQQGDFAGVDLISGNHARFFPQLGAQQRDPLVSFFHICSNNFSTKNVFWKYWF
tara:strand:- start:1720 stop:1980 length:261 start_codon:yes stop_codon:yes gene_type:complete